MFRDKYLKQVSLGYYLALSTDASVDENTPRASALHHGDVSFVSRRTRLTCMHASGPFLFISSVPQRRSITEKIFQGFDRWWEQRPAFASHREMSLSTG